MGLWVALVFALLPLLPVRRVPPLAALRRDFEPERARAIRGAGAWPWRWWRAPSVLAAIQVGSWRQGAIFAGGVAVALLVLWAASWALVRGGSALAAAGLPYSGGRACRTCTARPIRR